MDHFWATWFAKTFFQKSRFVTFPTLQPSNFMQKKKNQEKWRSNSEILRWERTDERTDEQGQIHGTNTLARVSNNLFTTKTKKSISIRCHVTKGDSGCWVSSYEKQNVFWSLLRLFYENEIKMADLLYSNNIVRRLNKKAWIKLMFLKNNNECGLFIWTFLTLYLETKWYKSSNVPKLSKQTRFQFSDFFTDVSHLRGKLSLVNITIYF